MKTKLFFIFIVCLLGMGIQAFGQDIIITHEADEIEAQVLQIDENQIIYQKADESVKRTIGKDKVLAIKYANGTKEVFKKTEARTSVPVSVAPASGNAALQEALNFPTDYSDLPRASRPYRLLDYYNENGIEGIVIEVVDGGYHGKIIALYEGDNYDREKIILKSGKYNWGKHYHYWRIPIGVSNVFNGEKNTSDIRIYFQTSSQTKKRRWDALKYLDQLGIGWYIPAYGELLRFFHTFFPYPGVFSTDDPTVLFNQLNDVIKVHHGKPIKWEGFVYKSCLSSTEMHTEDGFCWATLHLHSKMFYNDFEKVRTDENEAVKPVVRAFHRF